MGRNYKQITLAERCQITQLHAAGCKVRQIAAALGRAPSTIARELKRNGSRTKGYEPSYAQQQARARRWSGCRLERDQGLRAAVLSRLTQVGPGQEVVLRFRATKAGVSSTTARRVEPWCRGTWYTA